MSENKIYIDTESDETLQAAQSASELVVDMRESLSRLSQVISETLMQSYSGFGALNGALNQLAVTVSDICSVGINGTFEAMLAELSQTLSAVGKIGAECFVPAWFPSADLLTDIKTAAEGASSYAPQYSEDVNHQLKNLMSPTMAYVREHVWDIVQTFVAIVSVLLYFAPNKDQQKIIENQETIIAQNQQSLILDQQKNQLLEDICVALNNIFDETNVFDDPTGVADDISNAIIDVDNTDMEQKAVEDQQPNDD